MIPWRRGRLPTPVFWPGEFHRLYSPWGRKESDMTEQLSLHFTSHSKNVLLCEPYHFHHSYSTSSSIMHINGQMVMATVWDPCLKPIHLFIYTHRNCDNLNGQLKTISLWAFWQLSPPYLHKVYCWIVNPWNTIWVRWPWTGPFRDIPSVGFYFSWNK